MLFPNFSSGYSTFDPQTDVPNLAGKVILVTGANSGIGFTAALLLAKHGAKVYVGARDEIRGRAAVARIEAELALLPTGGTAHWIQIDVTTPQKARAGAEAFLAKESRLDVLINNAGIGWQRYQTVSEGGIAIINTMAVNYLGRFVLTQALTPVLSRTAKLPGSDVRIIALSSESHRMAPSNLNFRDLEGWNIPGKSTLDDGRRHGMSKLANILWIKELQFRFDASQTPITCVTVHPGVVWTEALVRFSAGSVPAYIMGWFVRMLGLSAERGAYTTVYAATTTKNREALKGQYLLPFDRVTEPSPLGKDRVGLGADLWKCSEELSEICLRDGK